jgi:hypothetical protein
MIYVFFVFLSSQTDMKGGEVLDQVFKRLNLLETPYFGLRYLDKTGQTVITHSWLVGKIRFHPRKGFPESCSQAWKEVQIFFPDKNLSDRSWAKLFSKARAFLQKKKMIRSEW